MVIITDANGNIQAPTLPDNVYQGSNLANEIVFLAPLPQSNSVVITFRLPNGILIEEQFMTPYTSVPSEYNLSAWRYVLEDAVTKYYGQVTFQIKVRNGQGTVITSVGGTFPVLRGVPSVPSSDPSESKWDAILEYVASINADLENGWLESKGLLPYDSEYEYSLGASLFDKSTNTIYTSLVNDNVGNPLSDATKWGKTIIYEVSPQYVANAIETHNTSASSHSALFDLKQNKTDNSLDTNNKTITGAINEVNGKVINKVDKTRTSGNFTGKIENGHSVLGIVDPNIYLSANETSGGVEKESTADIHKDHISLITSEGSSLADQKLTQIYQLKDSVEISVVDFSTLKSKSLKVDIDKVTIDNKKVPEALNSNSSSQEDTYSANYINSNFAPLSFASRLYLSKTSSSTASLVNTAPTPSATNTLEVTSTNTSFDWNTPTLTITRTLETAIQLNNTNSFAVDLYFDLSRNTVLTFGAKIKVSIDNGSTWTYISSNQSFGEKSYNSGFNSEDIVVYTDLATNETYPIGTLVAIELFKKQAQSSSLTTTYYCGVEIDGANVYSFVEFNFANTRINTNQIEDGAVTKQKLSSDLQDSIDKIGTASLNTTAQDLSGAVNELNATIGDIDTILQTINNGGGV